MSRRFRPFYVAAIAVAAVGIFGTEVIPRSGQTIAPESASVQSLATADDSSSWLGPLEAPSNGLLNLTGSLSILPFDIAR